MKKNLFIVLILTFFSYSSFAEIEGKGLICKCFNDDETRFDCNPDSLDAWAAGYMPYVGIFFKDGKVEVHYLSTIRKKNKDVLSIFIQKESQEYLIEPTYVQWPKEYNLGKYWGLVYFQHGTTFLDRKSLIMKNVHQWGNPVSHTDYRKYNCNSMQDMAINNPIVGYKKFKEQMDHFRSSAQFERDKLKEGNKF